MIEEPVPLLPASIIHVGYTVCEDNEHLYYNVTL